MNCFIFLNEIYTFFINLFFFILNIFLLISINRVFFISMVYISLNYIFSLVYYESIEFNCEIISSNKIIKYFLKIIRIQ